MIESPYDVVGVGSVGLSQILLLARVRGTDNKLEVGRGGVSVVLPVRRKAVQRAGGRDVDSLVLILVAHRLCFFVVSSCQVGG